MKVTYDETREADREFDFGVKDKKGRAVGAAAAFWTATWRETKPEDFKGTTWRYVYDYPRERPDERVAYRAHAPGTVVFMAIFTATRAGRPFGASQPHRGFLTAEEREAALEKYLKGARARALKDWGKEE